MVSNRIIKNIDGDLTSFFGPFIKSSNGEPSKNFYNLSVGNINNLEFLDTLLSELTIDEIKKMLFSSRNYPGTQGYFELNNLIAELIEKENKISVKPEQIVLTNGAVGALEAALFVYSDEFDKTFYSLPSFPYWAMAFRSQVVGSYFFTKGIDHYSSEFGNSFAEAVSIDKKIKTVIVENPHSPFGCDISKSQFKLLVETCSKKGIKLIYDDVYRSLINSEWLGKYLDFNESIIIDSFSKRCALPGFRLGFSVLPDNEVKFFRSAIANSSVGITNTVCSIAVKILDTFIKNNLFNKIKFEVNDRQNKLDFAIKKLKKFNISSPKPNSGIYRVLDVSDFCNEISISSDDLTKILLQNGVKVISNKHFYPSDIPLSKQMQFLRISVGGDNRITEAMDSLTGILEDIN